MRGISHAAWLEVISAAMDGAAGCAAKGESRAHRERASWRESARGPARGRGHLA